MRHARRTTLVLALGLLVAAALAAGLQNGHAGDRVSGGGDGVALTARHDALKGAAVRVEREQRRDALSSQRSVKHVVLVALFFAAVLASLAHSLRTTVTGSGFKPPVTSWWFRSGGRAPPSPQPTTV